MTGADAQGQAQTHPLVGTEAAPPRPLDAWAWLGIGVAAAAVGLLPWIITGMRLPLQNLWAAGTLPADMPFALLPFSQYYITLVAALLVIGAAIAGVVARSTRARLGRRGFVALTAGVLGAQLIAIVQTTTEVAPGLRPGSASLIYLVAVVAAALASFVVAALVLVLIARMPRAGALIGLSLAAVAAGWWVSALIIPSPGLVSDLQSTLVGLVRWLPAILCGIAIAWCGVTSIGRVLAALTAVAAVAVGAAFATAVTSAAGSWALARQPAEMLDYGVQVFGQALFTPALTLRPIVATLIVAGVGLVVAAVLRRRRLPVDET